MGPMEAETLGQTWSRAAPRTRWCLQLLRLLEAPDVSCNTVTWVGCTYILCMSHFV